MSETGSMVSSQRTMSSVRSRVGSRFFASSFPVFPFLLSLEPEYHHLWTYVGVIVQVAQMFSFVLNPHMHHGETLRAASRILYASHLPFWDDVFTSLRFSQYLGFFCIVVVLVLCPVAVGLWFILTHRMAPRDSRLVVVLRGALHLVTSVLFIPLMQGMLSQMVCLNGFLWSFPETKCNGSAGTVATFALGIVTFVLLNAMTLLVETTLFVDDYRSQHPLARKQFINSSLYTVWRTLSCILFHLLLSNSTNAAPTGFTYNWFPMYIFFSAGLMSASYVFYLPFLQQRMNRIFSGAFMTTAVIGIITFFSSEASLAPRRAELMEATLFAEMDIDGLVVMALASVFFFIGWTLADFRVNSEMTRSLKQLTDAAAEYPSHYTCLFPKGLPEYDVAYRTCMETCTDVADGAFKDNRVPVSLETPFLTRVCTYTDVEVATRFISTAYRITGQYPTSEMLSLATQIYMKGMFRYPESASVIIDFASMINAFTMKPSLALSQCERVNNMACSFPTRYRAYRLLANLKLSLHLRDTAYQSTCEDAKRAHKEILVSLSQFWNKLLSQQTDRSQILTTYSMIARKREDTNRMFLKALQQQTSDRDLLLKYADFLEQVMLQPDRAAKLRALAVEEIEEEHRHRGQPTKTRHGQRHRRQALALKFGDTNGHTRHIWGMRLDGQNILKVFTLCVILLIAIALIVVGVVGYKRRLATYYCVHHSSVARNLRIVGDMVGIQYFSQEETFAESGPRLHYLVSVAKDMLSIHNFLTFGMPKSLTRARERFVGAPKTMGATFADSDSLIFSASSFLSLGYDYAQFLEDVPGVIGRAANSVGTSAATSAAAQEARTHLETTRATLLDDYARKWKKGGYNASVLACRKWYEEERDVFTAVSAGLFGLAMIAIVFYAELSVLTSPVEKLKNRILSLFSFIPRNRLQEIAVQARQRVEAFDQTGDATSDDDDDHFAFQEVDEDNRATDVDDAPGGGGSGSGGASGGGIVVGGPLSSAADGSNRKGDPAGPSHDGLLSPASSGSPLRKRDGADGGLKDGTGTGFGESDPDADEEYGDHHALLWGSERAEGSNGFLSRSSLGRKGASKGNALEDAAVEGALSTEGGGVFGGDASGGSGLMNPRSSAGKAKARMRSMKPIRFKEQCFMLFVVVILVATLIVAALTAPMVLMNRTTQRNFAIRSSTYSQTEIKALQASFHLTAYFSSGEVELYESYRTEVSELESKLPATLGYDPQDEEMDALCDVAEAVSQMDRANPIIEAFVASPSGTVAQYDPTTGTLATNPDGEAARDSLFVSRGELNDQPVAFEAAMSKVLDALGETDDEVHTLATTTAQNETVHRFNITVIVLCVAGFVGQLAIALMIHFRNDPAFFRRTRCGWVLLILSMAAVLTTLILAIVIGSKVKLLAELRSEHVDIAGDHRRTVKSYLWPLVLAGKLVQQGKNAQLLSVMEYFDYVHDDTLWRSFASQLPDPSTGSLIAAHGERLFDFQMIALKLLATASGVTALELDNVRWDFDKEYDAMETRLTYADPLGLRYSTTEQDLARTAEEQIAMARDVISNARARDVVTAFNGICDSYFGGKLADVTKQLYDAHDSLDAMIMASTGTGAAAVFLTGVFVVVLLSQHARRRREQLGLLQDAFSNTFASTRIWLALIGIGALFAAVFAVNMADLLTMPERDAQLDYVNARAFHVVGNMIAAEQLSLGRLSVNALAHRYQTSWDELDHLNGVLTSGKTNIYGISHKLDNLLKGTDVELTPQFRYGFDPTAAGAEADQNGTKSHVFLYGVDNAVASWMHRSLELVEAAKEGSAVQITAALGVMRGLVMPLLRGLDESGQLFLEAVEQRTRAYFSASIALSAVLAVVVIAVAVFLVVPVARQQVVEETGYRMLVRLIPPEIRESIPAVREFMNSEATDGTYTSTSALAGGGGVTSLNGSGLGLATFDELATPIVAINMKGLVIKFNRQAEEVFGYSAAEVLGNNVSILMPERIARRHDGYLANYANLRKPGNRSVFQGQELLAKKKDGTLFDVRITVHEMKRGNADRAFVGFVEDISAKVKARQEEMLCRYIQDEAVVPMIAIDSLGTVLRFNKAAEECFGRSASEVLDQNVKILMPEDIAVRHDGYLATYLRTKEKHAIDNTVRARGVRKNGEEFPIELKIKEIVHDNVSTYVGFCRDLSTGAHLEEAVQINEVIFETSVIPVICTDMQGRVILFSKSAERVFGYTAEEVVSNNCKMLMPDTVADHHDTYLDRYRTSWSKRNAPIMSRQVMGRHKDGHLISLQASVHEVKSTSTSNTALVGFFRELSEERTLERGLNIDDVIADYHQLSLIVINSKGIIERVNKAALVEFGYHHPDDLLHKNVRMLMPSDVASRHDDYINRYLLTGIGAIIGASQDTSVFSPGRRVLAKRSDGSTFPAEIRLREVRKNRGAAVASSPYRLSGSIALEGSELRGGGDVGHEGITTGDGAEEVYFIGFLKNLTKDVRLERQVAINRTAMEYSPLPLCLLDANGRIAKVNGAAERTFRSRGDDLLGRDFTSMLTVVPQSAPSPMAAFASLRSPTALAAYSHSSASASSPVARQDDAKESRSSATFTNNASVTGGTGTEALAALLDKTSERILMTDNGERVPVDVFVRGVTAGTEPAEWRSGAAAAAAVAPPGYPYSPMGASGANPGAHSDGLAPPSSSAASVVAAGRGQPLAYLAYLRDTSEDGAAAVRASRNAKIAELSPVPLVQFDDKGHVIGMNAAAERQLGYPREEIQGKHVRLVLPDPLVLADMLLANTNGDGDTLAATVEGTSGKHRETEQSVLTSSDLFFDSESDSLANSRSQNPSRRRRPGAEPLQKRVKTEMRTKNGRMIPVELCVAEVVTQESAHVTVSSFIAYMYDQSGSIQLEAATEACQEYAEMSPHAIVIVNTDGIITMCNVATCRAFRYESVNQLVGQDVSILMPESIAYEHGGYLRSYLKTRQGVRVGRATMVQCRRSDGTLFPASMALHEVRLGAAELAGEHDLVRTDNRRGFTGVVADDPKEMMYVARFVDRSENGAINCAKGFMETLLQLSRDAAVLFFTDKGDLQKVSACSLALLGYDRADEIVGKPADLILPGLDLLHQMQGNTIAGTVTVTRRRNVVVRRKNGTTFNAQLHVRQVSVGEVTGFVGCIVDAREREDLHTRRKKNLALVEHSPIPILVMDGSGVIQTFSPAAEAFFGYSATDLLADDNADVLTLLPEMAEDRAVTEQLSNFHHGDGDGTGVDGASASQTSYFASDSDEADPGLQRLILAAAPTRPRARRFDGGSTGSRAAVPQGPETPADLGTVLDSAFQAETKSTGTLHGRHARLRHGAIVPVDVTVIELAEADSEQAQYAVFVVDRSLDNAVLIAQQLSDAVARSMPFPSLVVSEAGIILEANEHMSQLVDYSVGELEGQLVSITVPHKSLMNPSVGGGSAGRGEDDGAVYVRRNIPVLAKDGTAKMADAHVCVLPARGTMGSKGAVAGHSGAGSSDSSQAPRVLYVTFVDHSATTDLHRITQRFQTLFHSVTTPVMRLDAGKLRVLGYNEAADRLLGLDQSRRAVRGGRQHGAGVTTGVSTEEELDDMALLTDLLADPHGIKQIKRFIARESRSKATASPHNAVDMPTLRLNSKMRVRAGYNQGEEKDGDDASAAPFPVSFANAGPVNTTGRGSTTTERRGRAALLAQPTRTLEVELLLELVGSRVLLYIKDIAAERCQQLHTSLLAAMQTTLREPYMVVSDDDVIVSFNDAATRLLGYRLPPDGTVKATQLVEGGIIAMYAETAVTADAVGGSRELSVVHGSGRGDDVVVASIELSDDCPFAQRCGDAGVMRTVPLHGEHLSAAATAPDSPYAPLPFHQNALSTAASPRAERLPPVTSQDGSCHPRAGATAADSATAEASAAASTHEGVGKSVFRAEVRSRNRVVTKVPCRCSDGRTVPLDLRLCEVHVPLPGRLDGSEAARKRSIYTMVDPDTTAFESHQPDNLMTLGSGSNLGRSAMESHGDHDLSAALEEEEEAAAMARYYVVFLHDVQAKQNLDTSILLGEAIMEKSPSSIVVTDTAGLIVKFNAAAERLFGFDREHVLGKNVSLLMSEQHSARHDDYLATYMRTREQHVIGSPRRVIAERRDGEHILVELNVLEVLNDQGHPYLFIGFVQRIEANMTEGIPTAANTL